MLLTVKFGAFRECVLYEKRFHLEIGVKPREHFHSQFRGSLGPHQLFAHWKSCGPGQQKFSPTPPYLTPASFQRPRGRAPPRPLPAPGLQIPSHPAFAHITPEQDGRHGGHCRGWQLRNGKGGRRGSKPRESRHYVTFPSLGNKLILRHPAPTGAPSGGGPSGHMYPPPLGLGGGLLSSWTCILIGSFSVGGGWEPGIPPDWSEEAVFAFLLASQSWAGLPFQNI